MTGDPERLSDSLRRVLQGMGLESPERFEVLQAEWDALAGDQWSGRSRPLRLREGELVVEAESASLVSFLRYSVGDLQERIDNRLGPGVVESIRVQAPKTA
jgi:hypothetical protein